jgi:hypothetical protein
MNNPRTLSGVNGNTIEQLNLPSTIDAILIDGNPGERGQVIAKNETTNKLEWDKVDDISIPINSISGDKLKTNITFSTTGLIRAHEFFSNYFIVPQNGTQQVIIDSDGITMVGNLTIDASNTELRIDNIICSGNGGTDPTILVQDGDIGISDGMLETFVSETDAIRINNGGDIALYSDNSQNLSMRIDANSGTITILSNGKIQTYGVDEIMRILNGGDINFYSDNLGNTSTLQIKGSNGQIEMNGGGNLEIKNGGDIELYDGNNDKRVELVSADGDIKLYNSSGGNTIELDGASDNINVFLGGNIRLYENDPQPALFINLDGSNGLITCRDIDITNHSGNIELDNIFCNTFSIPKSGASSYFLTNNSLTMNGYNISASTTSATYKNLVLSNTGGTLGSDTLIIEGTTETTTDGAGNLGNIKMNSGDLTLTSGDFYLNSGNFLQSGTTSTFITNSLTTFKNAVDFQGNYNIDFVDGSNNLNLRINNSNGNLTLTNGELEVVAGNSIFRGGADFIGNNSVDIIDSSSTLQFRLNPSTGDFTASGGDIVSSGGDVVSTTGNITATIGDVNALAGTLRSNKVGSKPAPEDSSSYTDWALTLSNTNSHAYIGGNLICDGTIYANIEGTITEEVVDCQRLNIRTDPSGSTGGNTEINFNDTNGLLTGYFDSTGTGTVYTNYSTPMKHMRLDSTNYKNSQYEIGVNIPNTSMRERIFSTTSTSWTDLNDQLSIRIQSDGSQLSYYVVDFSFYAVITAGARLWLKLYDSALGIDNTSQLPVYNNTMSQVLLDTNGGSDFAGVHNVRFLLYGIPKNHNNTVRVACWIITSGNHKVIFKSGGRVLGSNATNPSLTFDKYPPQVLQVHKILNSTNISTASPTGWTAPSGTLTESPIDGEKLMSYSYIDNDSQNFTRIYNTSNKWIFDGNQNSGTDTLEVHFTATSSTGYLEFGFYANTLTAGMIFHCGVAVATGGTSPFSTTLTSSAVSIDGYKLGLFNGDTSRYSLKEILDFTSYENTFLTSKFHFNNLTVGTEYKMALYGRCNYTGSIYINTGGKSTTGTANRSAHQPAFLKFYQFDSNLGGTRTDDTYVGGNF